MLKSPKRDMFERPKGLNSLEGSFSEDVLPPEGSWPQPLMLKSPKRDIFSLPHGPGPIWAHMGPYGPMGPYVYICLYMPIYVYICLYMSIYVYICLYISLLCWATANPNNRQLMQSNNRCSAVGLQPEQRQLSHEFYYLTQYCSEFQNCFCVVQNCCCVFCDRNKHMD